MISSYRCLLVAFLVLVLSAIAVATQPLGKTRRNVTCTGIHDHIPDGALALYHLMANQTETVNFDALVGLMGVVTGGVDLSEYINTAHLASHAINNATDGKGDGSHDYVAKAGHAWNNTWSALVATVLQEAEEFLNDGDNISAANALQRAFTYSSIAGRFSPLHTPAAVAAYVASVELFERFMNIPRPGFVNCQRVRIPLNITSPTQGPRVGFLHGYWCPAAAPHPSGVNPTIVVMTGYDGTAEFLWQDYQDVGRYGYNQLYFEGPGQGYVARVENLTFIPEYELVVTTALDYIISTFHVDDRYVFLMGVSFGGYLAPRAFAFESRFIGLIADGGVLDFYQGLFCPWPEELRNMYLSGNPGDEAVFDGIVDGLATKVMGIFFGLEFGKLGFGAHNYSSLLDLAASYSLYDQMNLFANRSLIVLNPAWDTLLGKQSELFWNHLPAVAEVSEIYSPDPYRGMGLHCAVGSTSNVNIHFWRWMNKVLKKAGGRR